MTILIKDSVGSLTFYLETSGGSPATGLDTTDVQVDLRKSDEAFFQNKSLDAPVNATASIGSGANGTVTVSVPGSAGNTYSVEVVSPVGTSHLLVTKAGSTITVKLSVSSGTPVGSENTALLIAAAINDLGSEVVASASGDGSGSLALAEGPTSLAGGIDGTFTELGSGYYELVLSKDDTDTEGVLAARIQGPTIRSALQMVTVASATPANPTPSFSVPTTSIFGYLLKANGAALTGASVAAKVLSQPTVLHPGSQGLALSTDLLTTTTDSDGYFSIDLVSGSTVDIFIPSVNYRRTFVVPSSSSNLFDIP